MFVPLDKKPEAIQKRGDRISIFRPEAERLLTLPDSAFSTLLRALLQWFKDGSDCHLEDPMADCYLQSLKEAQLRIVDEVWKKHATNKANRGKVRSGHQANDSRQQPSTVEDSPLRQSTNDDECRQAEAIAESKAVAESKAKSETTSIPELADVIAWGKSVMIDEAFLRESYGKANSNGWMSSRGMISDWRKYFKAWSDRVGGDVKTWHNKMLDGMNDSESTSWSDWRKIKVLEYFAKKHDRKMVRGENGIYWPAPFDFMKEMQLANKEYDEAADRGEVDIYYRSRYY